MNVGLEGFPLMGDLHRLAGALYEEQGNRSEAIAAYGRAVGLNRRDSVSLRRLGFLELLNNGALGVEYLKRQLLIVPEDVGSAIAIAGHFLEVGQLEDGKGYLDNARLFDPENSVIQSMLATIADAD